MPNEEDDFYASGNLEDEPQGHPGVMDEDALAARRKRMEEALGQSEMDLLLAARKAMIVDLLIRVEDGIAMPADMANLRALLKDNGVVMGDPLRGPREIDQNPRAVREPISLPSFERPEYDEEE